MKVGYGLKVALGLLLSVTAGSFVGAIPPERSTSAEANRGRIDGPRMIGRSELLRELERRRREQREHFQRREIRRDEVRPAAALPDVTGDPRIGILPDAPGGELDRLRRGGAR